MNTGVTRSVFALGCVEELESAYQKQPPARGVRLWAMHSLHFPPLLTISSHLPVQPAFAHVPLQSQPRNDEYRQGGITKHQQTPGVSTRVNMAMT